MFIDDAITHHAKYRGSKPALIFDDQELAFSALNERISRCANMLIGMGVRRGDRVAIVTEKLAPTNASQVERVRQIVEGLGMEVATPADARKILALKGADRVGF